MNIEGRTLEFAQRVVHVCRALPRDRAPGVVGSIKTEANELIAIFVSLINKWRGK